MAAQAFLLLALAPVEMRLWGWDLERWFLVPWVRGWGKLILAAWLASWGWGVWWWRPVIPGVWRAVVFGLPLFGLPLAGSWGWLDRSRWPAAEPVSGRAAPDFNVVPAFIGGVAVTALVLAWMVDPRAEGAGRTALVWLAVGALHAAGWSARRSVLWLLPFPVPAIGVLRWVLGERDKSLAWYAFSNTHGSRRWARWDSLGRGLSADWERLPWRDRWRGAGRAPGRPWTRSDRRQRLRRRLQAAHCLPHGILLGFGVEILVQTDLRLETPFPPWLRLALWTSVLLMLLGAVPSLLRWAAQSLALSRGSWAVLASWGGRLSIAVYLLTAGGLIGLLLASGESRLAGAVLTLGMCLLALGAVLVVLLRQGLGALPFLPSEPGPDRGSVWLAVPLLAAVALGVPLVAWRGWPADAAAWFLFLSAVLSPAGAYLLRRLP